MYRLLARAVSTAAVTAHSIPERNTSQRLQEASWGRRRRYKAAGRASTSPPLMPQDKFFEKLYFYIALINIGQIFITDG